MGIMIPKRPNHEIGALTSIRALAATWVLIFHIRLNGEAIGIDPQSFVMQGRFFQSGYLGVDIFFVLSGFIITLTYGADFSTRFTASLYPFFLKRFARIYPVHIFALSLFFFVYVANIWRPNLILHPENFPLSDLPAQALLIHAWGIVPGSGWNLPSWSMSMEVLAYLLFPVLIYVLKKFGTALFLFLCGFFVIIYFLLPYGNTGMPGVARVLSEFSFGMLLSQLTDNPHFQRLKSDIVTVATVAVIIVLATNLAPNVSGSEHEQLIIFPAALLIFSLDRDKFQFLNPMKSNFMIYLGKISYSLYATHAFVLLVVYRFVRTQHFGDLTTFIICVSVPFLFAAITYHLVEHPCRLRLIRTLHGGFRRSVAA